MGIKKDSCLNSPENTCPARVDRTLLESFLSWGQTMGEGSHNPRDEQS